jgi:hypothetical protein
VPGERARRFLKSTFGTADISTMGSTDTGMLGRLAEGRVQTAAQLQRLDPFTFWTLPSEGAADFVVVGATGAFLVAVVPALGKADVHKGHLVVDGVSLDGGRRLRAEAKRLQLTLSRANVAVRVEPVLCLTHAIAGAPRSDRGVRVVQVRDLAKDMTDRPQALPHLRAQRAARALGMKLDGDEQGIVVEGR